MNGNNNQFFNTPQNNFFPQNNNMPVNNNNIPNQQQMNQVSGQMYNQQNINNVQQPIQQPQMVQQPVGQVAQQQINQQPVAQQVPVQNVEQQADNSFVMATVPKDSLKTNNIADNAVQSITNDNVAKLDPLNNSSNPIPINPIAPKEEKTIETKMVTPFDIIKTIFDVFKKPGRLLEETVPKFSTLISSITFTGFLTGFSVILMIITRIIVGGFIKSYDNATGSYTSTFNFANVGNQDFLHYIIVAVILSGIVTLGVGLIYYASSFVNSKGMTMGKSIMISNVSFIPMILGVIAGAPIGGILSGYMSFIIFGVSIAYSLILLVTGINMYVESDNINIKIIYNLVNFALSIVVVALAIYLFYGGTPLGLAISTGVVGS